MDREFDKVVQDALSLGAEERGELVDRLIVSICQETSYVREQFEEARRRSRAHDLGEIEAVDAKDALERVRKLRNR